MPEKKQPVVATFTSEFNLGTSVQQLDAQNSQVIGAPDKKETNDKK